MHLPQFLPGYMGIDFCRADAGMAEQFLDDTQVGAIFQQMSGKAMAEHVRSHRARNTGAFHPLLDSEPERHGRERGSSFRQENGRR